MDKFLLALWNSLFNLRVYHARCDGDETNHWVQWSDIEELIHSLIETHTAKVTDSIRQRSKQHPLDSWETAVLRDTIAQLRHRLQDHDEKEVATAALMSSAD